MDWATLLGVTGFETVSVDQFPLDPTWRRC